MDPDSDLDQIQELINIASSGTDVGKIVRSNKDLWKNMLRKHLSGSCFAEVQRPDVTDWFEYYMSYLRESSCTYNYGVMYQNGARTILTQEDLGEEWDEMSGTLKVHGGCLAPGSEAYIVVIPQEGRSSLPLFELKQGYEDYRDGQIIEKQHNYSSSKEGVTDLIMCMIARYRSAETWTMSIAMEGDPEDKKKTKQNTVRDYISQLVDRTFEEGEIYGVISVSIPVYVPIARRGVFKDTKIGQRFVEVHILKAIV